MSNSTKLYSYLKHRERERDRLAYRAEHGAEKWSDCYRPRPVLEWLCKHAITLLNAGHDPDRVILGWFGESIAELNRSGFGRILHRKCAVRRDLKLIADILESR